MKKMILTTLLMGLSSFAMADNFSARIEKFGDRGYKIIEVTKGETNISNAYTDFCKSRYGIALFSINNETGRGSMMLDGRNCTVLRVERLKPDEQRPPAPPVQPVKGPTIINPPGVELRIYNNIGEGFHNNVK